MIPKIIFNINLLRLQSGKWNVTIGGGSVEPLASNLMLRLAIQRDITLGDIHFSIDLDGTQPRACVTSLQDLLTVLA